MAAKTIVLILSHNDYRKLHSFQSAQMASERIGSTIKNFRGSPMEDTTIAGIKFKTTTYKNWNGMTQTMNVAFRNGTKITITLEGVNTKEVKDTADIRAMLATMVLK